LKPTGLEWGLREVIENANMVNPNMGNQQVLSSVDAIIEHISTHAKAGDAIVIMSNGGFEGIHQRLITALRTQ
jgi:UDP-N-acetylmuramate: L-alanyl-gamma-D-glutamyl-meso-diaminopimelate ligase